MTWKYKALALGAGFAAAMALSACGRGNNVTAPATSEAPATTSAPEAGAPATSAPGTMGGAETSAPATSSPSAGG